MALLEEITVKTYTECLAHCLAHCKYNVIIEVKYSIIYLAKSQKTLLSKCEM